MRWLLTVLALLFTLTGCTALLAEQAFEKLLSTLLGASTPAAATVLAVYFAGLTLGGILAGRWCRSSARPLRLYAVLELCVGFWALVLYLSFDRLIPFFAPLLALGVNRFWVLQCLRVFVAACWILPATVPMGASFPAVVHALEQLSVPQRGRAMARFYSFNLAGAIVGAVIGPFIVFPYWGVDGALLLTFVVNLVVGFTSFALSRKPAPPKQSAEEDANTSDTPLPRLILAVAFASGFLFFALEVTWTHLIGAVLGNSIYAFAAMLAVVLLGLGLGGAYTAARSSSHQTIPTSELGNLLLCTAVVLALMNGRWPDVPQALAALGARVVTFGMAEFLRWLLATAMLLLLAMLLGMVYPTLFRLEIFPSRQQGKFTGRMVAANAIGCIAGALVTGFGLISWIGAERTLAVLTTSILFLGLVILFVYRTHQSKARMILLAAATVGALAIQPPWNRLHLTSGRHVYFRQAEVSANTDLKSFHEDAFGGITTVVDNPVSGDSNHVKSVRTLLTNGKFQGNDGSEMEAQTGFALVPILFVPTFHDALVIGLGTGRTAHVVDALGFDSVDVAEIAPGVVQAARRYFNHINGAILDDPHVHVFLEDGRNLLLLRPKQYDLITIELTSVWFAGAANLYSEQFYRLARSRLKPTGILQEWIQLHHIGNNELLTVIGTLRRVFPHVSMWVVGGQGILVASTSPQLIQPASLDALQKHGSMIGWDVDELKDNLRNLMSCRLLAPEDVSSLVESRAITLNTDRNRRLEYFTPRYNYSPFDWRKRNVEALAFFASFRPPELAADCSGELADACRQIDKELARRRFGLGAEQTK
jgi:spermidine synthase